MSFAAYNHADYPFLALGEEAGEVLGKLAKYVRKNKVDLGTTINIARIHTCPILRGDLESELGDVLWQLTACCDSLDISLNELMHHNLKKLTDRNTRGVIVGIGDKR